MDGGAVPRYVTSQCEHKDTNEADEEKRGDSPCTVRSVGVVVSPVSSPNHVMYFFFLFFFCLLSLAVMKNKINGENRGA
jgi:hypothetical protein